MLHRQRFTTYHFVILCISCLCTRFDVYGSYNPLQPQKCCTDNDLQRITLLYFVSLAFVHYLMFTGLITPYNPKNVAQTTIYNVSLCYTLYLLPLYTI